MYLVYYEDYTVPHTFCASEENTNTELNMEGAGQVPELKYMKMNTAASAMGFEVMALRQVVTTTDLWQASCQSCITRKGWKFLFKQLGIQESTSYT